MSQAKVEQYKKEKANRKQTLAKQKVLKHIRHAIEIVVVIAIVALIGYNRYDHYQKTKPAETYYADITSVSDYMAELSE